MAIMFRVSSLWVAVWLSRGSLAGKWRGRLSTKARTPSRKSALRTQAATPAGRFRSSVTSVLPRRRGLSAPPPSLSFTAPFPGPGDHRHLGAHVGEHPAGQRSGAQAFELDDANAGKRRLHATSLRAISSFMISLAPP